MSVKYCAEMELESEHEKKNNNTEELVSFVDWRRISGMPGEKRIVVKRVTIEFQKRQYFKQYCLHFL